MMKKRMTAGLITTLLLVSAFTGCAQSGTKTPAADGTKPADNTQAAAAQSITLPETDPTDLTALRASDGASISIAMETQTVLVRLRDGKIIGDAASSWEKSDDATTWTFHLRDLVWSDGKKITASEFVYNILTTLDPKTASANGSMLYIIKGAEDYNSGKGTADGVGVKAVDDKTLQITLTGPVPYFDQIACYTSFSPLRKDLYEAQGDAFGSDPTKLVYAGPYTITNWTRGSTMTLKKNPSYWDAANVKIDTVNLVCMSQQSTLQQLFDAKQIDALGEQPQEYLDKLKPKLDSGDVTMAQYAYPSTTYIAFNTQDPDGIFTNAKVRMAFSIAIDRDSYVKNVVKTGRAAYGFIPYSLAIGDQEFRAAVPEPLTASMKQDPKQLLADGLKELGKDPTQKISVTFLQRNNDQDKKVIGEFYQNQWMTKLGVDVQIKVAGDSATFNGMLDKGQYQVAEAGWGADYNDPMTFMQLLVTGDGNNATQFNNPDYDKLVKDAAAVADMAKRLDDFKQAEQMAVVDQAAVSPIRYTIKNFLTQGYVKNLKTAGFSTPGFGEVRDAYIQK